MSGYNPAVGEPHTTSFMWDSKTSTDFVMSFVVPSSTKIMAQPPGYNGQPTMTGPFKNAMNTIIGINGRVDLSHNYHS